MIHFHGAAGKLQQTQAPCAHPRGLARWAEEAGCAFLCLEVISGAWPFPRCAVLMTAAALRVAFACMWGAPGPLGGIFVICLDARGILARFEASTVGSVPFIHDFNSQIEQTIIDPLQHLAHKALRRSTVNSQVASVPDSGSLSF